MRVLLLNQCFYPDVVSTAQHLTDLAVRLADLGHEVTVLAGRRGYDNPELRFRKREVWRRITVLRISATHFGKTTRWRRALDFGSYLAACAFRLLLLPRFDAVFALTSPPLISLLGALFVKLKGGRLFIWVMDLNPDEAVAAGWLRRGSVVERTLASALRYSFECAGKVIALDRFMKGRIVEKGIPEERIVVIPPWPHDDVVHFDPAGRAAFRSVHGLDCKYVVMYSGNHSPCHPLNTLLEAAASLHRHPEIHFCFVGGGTEFEKTRAFARDRGLANVTCLPYQPLKDLSASLSAADLHVIVMGDSFVGLVHPCKIYNVLSVGSSFLYIGPRDSHVTDIICGLGNSLEIRQAAQGDAVTVARHILDLYRRSSAQRPEMQKSAAAGYSKETLLPRITQLVASAQSALPDLPWLRRIHP